MQTRFQQWPLNFRTWRHLRQSSQVLVYASWTDHLRDLRRLCAGRVLSCNGAGLFCAFRLGEQVRERAKSNQRHKGTEEAKNGSN